MMGSVSPAVTMDIKAGYSLRMLQIAEVLSGENSETYAQYLIQVLKTIEGGDTGGKVIQEAVEYSLTYIRTGALSGMVRGTYLPVRAASFSAVGGITVLLTALTEESVVMGPTFLLIAAALACEYNKSVAVSPESMLRGLSTRFPVCTGRCITMMVRGLI